MGCWNSKFYFCRRVFLLTNLLEIVFLRHLLGKFIRNSIFETSFGQIYYFFPHDSTWPEPSHLRNLPCGWGSDQNNVLTDLSFYEWFDQVFWIDLLYLNICTLRFIWVADGNLWMWIIEPCLCSTAAPLAPASPRLSSRSELISIEISMIEIDIWFRLGGQ